MTAMESGRGGEAKCVLDVWEESARDDEICATAIGTLIVSHTELVKRLNSIEAVERCLMEKIEGGRDTVEALPWLLALSQIMTRTGRGAAAESFCERAIEVIAKSGWNSEQICEHAEHLAEMIQSAGHEATGNKIRRRLRTRALMGEESTSGYFELREVAFESYREGAFGEAEKIYRYLISKDYDKPGTLCHLARVLVGLGRDVEASDAVEEAFLLRAGAEGYVIARIYYLRGVLAALGGRDVEGQLAEVKRALEVRGNRTEWLLGPMLEAVSGRMGGDVHARFVELGGMFREGEE